MDLSVSHFAQSRPGHPQTDDAFACLRTVDGLVAAVADGVGSAREGGEAARRTVRQLTDNYAARPATWHPERALRELASQLNSQLYQESQLRHGTSELACTLCAAVVAGNRLWIINAGDSTAWLWRNGELRRLAEPHVAAHSPGALTRALGFEPEVAPDVFSFSLADGDRLLLCTDGVDNALSRDRLLALLGSEADAREIVSTAQAAAAGDGKDVDDACALLVRIVTCGEESRAAARLEILEPLHPGQSVGGLLLERPLVSSGRVWLARRETDGAERVVKFPPLEARDDDRLRTLFGRELAHATQIAAPYFPRAEAPKGDVVNCYSLEYVASPTLQDCLRQRPLATEEVLALGRFLTAAAQHLLGPGLVHGDIKPENILVTRRGPEATFLLIDFGSVAPVFSVAHRAGTASYLAPERLTSAPHTERTELFAIGVTLFQAATGAFPYGEIERFQTPRLAHPRQPCRLNPALPPWLESILLRAIAVQPEQRYQHYSELAFDLEHPAEVEPFIDPAAPLSQRNPLLLWKLIAGLLAALNLLQLWLRH